MAKRTHGKTASGVPVTDELVEKLADNAEAGYDIEDTLRRRDGRPPLGSAPASVESVRPEPKLRQAPAQRAERDHLLGDPQGDIQVPRSRLTPADRAAAFASSSVRSLPLPWGRSPVR